MKSKKSLYDICPFCKKEVGEKNMMECVAGFRCKECYAKNLHHFNVVNTEPKKKKIETEERVLYVWTNPSEQTLTEDEWGRECISLMSYGQLITVLPTDEICSKWFKKVLNIKVTVEK